MAEQADEPQGDELDDEILDDEPQGDDEGDQDQGDDGGSAEDDEGDDVQIMFGDEAAPASEDESGSGLVRELRAKLREANSKVARYERGELEPPAKPQVIEVGEKPTLAGCDYDEERFEAERDAWDERKRQAEEAKARSEQEQQARTAELAKDFERFTTGKKALGFRDFDAAENEVVSVLSMHQQSAIVQAADDPAKVIYALGKHPAKLNALAAISNPVKFVAAVAKLEGTLKVTKTNRQRPAPESIVRGSAPLSAGKDKHLEKLEAQASRTGDRSALIAYRAKLKKQGK